MKRTIVDILVSLKVAIQCGWKIFKIQLIEKKNRRVIDNRRVFQ
jgi:hypothetical protein